MYDKTKPPRIQCNMFESISDDIYTVRFITILFGMPRHKQLFSSFFSFFVTMPATVQVLTVAEVSTSQQKGIRYHLYSCVMQHEQPWFIYLQVVLKCVEHQRCRITAPHWLSVHGHRYLSKMQWLNLFFFFKYCCSKNVFIYLDVTDYLKNFRFLFSLRCSVLFSFVITMKWLTSLIYGSN